MLTPGDGGGRTWALAVTPTGTDCHRHQRTARILVDTRVRSIRCNPNGAGRLTAAPSYVCNAWGTRAAEVSKVDTMRSR